MKKTVLLAVAALAGFAALADHETYRDDAGRVWTYRVMTSGDAAILGVQDDDGNGGLQPAFGDVVMPSKMANRYEVTHITTMPCPEMQTLRIPATVTGIDDGAFAECARLWNVVFEGKKGDDLDYEAKFSGTSFLQTIRSYEYNRNPKNAMWQYVSSVAKDKCGEMQDNNQYDSRWQDWLDAVDVGEKWFAYDAPSDGYMTLNVWKSDCDVDIAVYQGAADGSLPAQPTPIAVASVESGYLHFSAKKGVTYYIGIDGWKNKTRKARGTFTVNWHFGPKLATVKLNLKGGSLPIGVKQFKVPKGQSVGNLPTPVREGYSFAGWYQNSALTKSVKSSTKVNGNVTAYAKWTPKKYLLTVAGDRDKGKYSGLRGTPTDSKYKGKRVYLKGADGVKAHFKAGSSVTLVAEPKKDFVFQQWVVNGDFEGKFFPKKRDRRSKNANIKMPTQDVEARPCYIDLARDYVEIFGPDTWYFEDGSTITLRTDTATVCDIKATGSKKELTQNLSMKKHYLGDTLYVTFTANKKILAKPGLWKITLTATSAGGKTAKKTIAVVGKMKTQAIDNGHLTGLDTRTAGTSYTNFYVGVRAIARNHKLGLDIAPKGASWRILSVTGVPGLSWRYLDGFGYFGGVPTKAGTFMATVTVERPASKSKKNGKTVYVTRKLETATAVVVVNPFPEGYAGVYYGYSKEPFYHYDENKDKNETVYLFGEHSRKFKMTVTAAGAVYADLAGAQFTGNLENWMNNTDFRYLTFSGTISGNGTGKNKKTKTWQDDLYFDIDMDFIEDPDNGSGYGVSPVDGTSTRWRIEGNKTLFAYFTARKNLFKEAAEGSLLDSIWQNLYYDFDKPKKNGEYQRRVTRLAYDCKMTADEAYEAGIGSFSDLTLLRTDLNSDVPTGDAQVYFGDSVGGKGTALVEGSVKDYNGASYNMDGNAMERIVLDIEKPNYFVEVPYLEDDDPENRYVVTARYFKDGHILEIVWYIGEREELEYGMSDPKFRYRVKGAVGHFWK